MFAEETVRFSESSEVDDAFDCCGFGGLGEVACELSVALCVVFAGRFHGVDEVVRGGCAFEDLGEGVDVREVALFDADSVV